jgi:coilin
MEVTAAEGEQTLSRETCGGEVVTEETTSSRDYSGLPALLGAPRIGDTIAFKVLELSTNCTPEISDYKEAEVVEYDVSNSSVTLRYYGHAQQGDTLQQGSQRSALLRGVLTEEDEEEEKDRSHDNHVTLSLGSLLQPKLIT